MCDPNFGPIYMPHDKHRGYFGIGIQGVKNSHNTGTLWRSAYCLGANFIFTIGERYQNQCSDTTKSYRHIPYWRMNSLMDFHDHIPYDCQVVGIESTDEAVDLRNFVHPERCMYVLGPEDGSLSKELVDMCQYIVKIDSRYCLNVAVAGSIVMYDRACKG